MDYIISRPRVSDNPKEFAADLYFNLWEKKNWPYQELQKENVLYWYESRSQTLLWKTRIVDIEKFFYKDKDYLLETLRSRFGSFKEDHPYLIKAPASGHCLAYKIQPSIKLNIPKPATLRFPHLGWLKGTDPHVAEWLSGLTQDSPSSATNASATIHYWWVNQNKTFTSEISGGFLWSPEARADGARNQFYENMRLVNPGDVVFSFQGSHIKAVGIATGRAELAPKPNFGKAGSSWSNDGWLVPVEFRVLSNPIRPKDHIEQLRPHLPDKYSPLQESGDGLQSVYLAAVPNAMAETLIRLLGSEYSSIVGTLSGDGVALTDEEDAAEQALQGRTDIGATEKSQLAKARRGQGVFRANVRLNEKACRVTGITSLKHLRASHIKPWKDSSDEEKLNGCNGLLLAPHIDHLFDKGFISFDSSGEMLISEHLDPDVLRQWNIPPHLNVGRFNKEQIRFLDYHRAHRFKP